MRPQTQPTPRSRIRINSSLTTMRTRFMAGAIVGEPGNRRWPCSKGCRHFARPSGWCTDGRLSRPGAISWCRTTGRLTSIRICRSDRGCRRSRSGRRLCDHGIRPLWGAGVAEREPSRYFSCRPKAVRRRRLLPGESNQSVQRALDPLTTDLQHLRVDHRCRHIGMSQQILDSADVAACLQQVRGERMTKCVL